MKMVIFMKKIIIIWLIIIICIHIPINVWADDIDEEEADQIQEMINASTGVDTTPKLNARACIIYDRESQKVLFEKNAYSKRPMASTTKIMTAIIVLEKANLETTVEISKKAGGTGGSRLGLKANDKISVKHLLYGLMLRSRK